ncbi:uncharacterized protein LOC143468228 [Clavelina lepadiformis]|uniref:uncharacterized protein LOC143468228 n=1 Tax=Clavelina lepadiformis TaxID=159417 RepID=UPI0040435C69
MESLNDTEFSGDQISADEVKCEMFKKEHHDDSIKEQVLNKAKSLDLNDCRMYKDIEEKNDLVEVNNHFNESGDAKLEGATGSTESTLIIGKQLTVHKERMKEEKSSSGVPSEGSCDEQTDTENDLKGGLNENLIITGNGEGFEVEESTDTETGLDSGAPLDNHILSLDEDLHNVSGSQNSDDEDDIASSQERKSNRRKSHSNGTLEWIDNQHQGDTMHRFDVFRRSKQLCDLVILVGGHEIHCHRVVVGAASSAIFDELSRGEQEVGPVARIPLDVALPGLLPDAVDILVDYMYTSKLSMSSHQLMAVYRASLQLGVERVTPLCRRYIMNDLDVDQCVQIRRLAQSNRDFELRQYVDEFIEENFESVASSTELLSLPRIKMEVVVSPNTSITNLLSVNTRDGMLCTIALSWLCGVIQQKGGNYMEELIEQIQRVPLEDLNNAPSSLSNCNWRQDEHKAENGARNNGSFSSIRLSRSSSMDSLNSSESGESSGHIRCCPEGEWKVIASTQSQGTEHMIALCCLGDLLCALSIRLPSTSLQNGDLANLEQNGFQHNFQSSSASSSTSCSSSIGSVNAVAPLHQARCAAGVAQLNGKLLIAGGFNQSECLDSVESFDAVANRWSMITRMNEKRARFAVGVLRGHLYAVGGSSGSHDQMSVERYDPNKDVWNHVQPLLTSCSAAGVAVLNDRLYCVGGVQQNRGVVGIKTCQVYNPDENQWSPISSMHTGRSSLGVAAMGGFLYAVAGSDGWTCLATAEKYDPASNSWTYTAPLNVQRRGLGMTAHNDALYCVGGFDGQTFLNSVERYCPTDGNVWTLIPSALTVPRNNVGLVSLNNNVFAVGGFSGRQFLSSVEILDDGNCDWPSQDSHTSSVGVTNESD